MVVTYQCLEAKSENWSYKVPESLKIIDKIPRNDLGKIDRKLLLAMISEKRKL